MNARAIIDEAIDPKRIFHSVVNRKPKPESISIFGRRWWRRTYGGTYHTADIYVNGQFLHRTARQYGYGDQYLETAWQWLENEGYVPKRDRSATSGGTTSPWRAAEELGIQLEYSVTDVKRQRDL